MAGTDSKSAQHAPGNREAEAKAVKPEAGKLPPPAPKAPEVTALLTNSKPAEVPAPEVKDVPVAANVKVVSVDTDGVTVAEEPAKRLYKRADFSKITVDSLESALEELPEDEDVVVQGNLSEDRSPLQQKIDAHVKDAHELWVAAGKPAGFAAGRKAKVVRRYLMDPGEEQAYRSLLRNAATFLRLKIRYMPLQDHKQSGRKQLPWMAMDKPTRAAAPKAPESAITGKAPEK
jgi:hypothetical protein